MNSFKIAEKLQFQPLANVYYNEAKLFNMLSDKNNKSEETNWETSDALRNAFKQGFSDTTALMKEPRLTSFIKTKEFKSVLSAVALDKMRKNGDNFFDTYKQSFPKVENSFEIPVEKVAMEEYKESISYDFEKFIPEMQNTSFGRDVSNDYFFVANVKETPKYTAILYSSISFYGESMQPVFTKLTTYNNDGEIIANKLFACQCSAEKVKKGKIDNDLITLEDYKRVWEKPITEVSFEENKVKSYDLVAKATFKLDENGNIVEQSVPANYNDSTLMASAKIKK